MTSRLPDPPAPASPRVRVALLRDPIELAAAEQALHGPATGGIVTFAGTIRDHNAGRRVLHLEYEAYEEMALAQMEAIARHMAEAWPLDAVVLLHRLGRLEIGEAAVFVGVASAHRAAAFEACRHGIDAIKAEVPIWKRESFDGGVTWVPGHRPDPV